MSSENISFNPVQTPNPRTKHSVKNPNVPYHWDSPQVKTFNFIGSACNTEIDVNAPGNDVGPATNQGSVRKCQLHCRANNVKYFTWRQADGNCWCKRLIKKENESGHFSGEALCAIGKGITEDKIQCKMYGEF